MIKEYLGEELISFIKKCWIFARPFRFIRHSKDNGIKFMLLRCYISSMEANIHFYKDKEKMSKFYGEFIDLGREQRLMHILKDYRLCWMNRMVAVDFDGQLYRCCGVYEEKYFLGNLFDYKIREIKNIKSKVCEICIKTPISWR